MLNLIRVNKMKRVPHGLLAVGVGEFYGIMTDLNEVLKQFKRDYRLTTRGTFPTIFFGSEKWHMMNHKGIYIGTIGLKRKKRVEKRRKNDTSSQGYRSADSVWYETPIQLFFHVKGTTTKSAELNGIKAADAFLNIAKDKLKQQKMF